ncbi:MAG: ornithine cyclodeaminase family protein, partial [Methanosarcinales archaeon]
EPVVGCDIIPKESVESVCKCDILVTTTPVRSPIVKKEWISEGVHINAIGADAKGKQELDSNILKRAKIVVDDLAQASHSGEINVPLSNGIISLQDIYGELGEIIAGIKRGREEDNEITIFDSTGLAVQDVATANLIYKKAIEIDLGRWLKLF